MYIKDLPPEVLFKLYTMLDQASSHRNWERLGALAGFKSSEIESFRRAQFANASPTEELLRIWGYKLATVTMLFNALAELKHGLGMKLLKNHVDPELHYKIREVEGEPLDNGGPSVQRQGPDPRVGMNQPSYTPPANHTGPAPLMTPDKSLHEQPSFPYQQRPQMQYAPYNKEWATQHSPHPPSGYSSMYPGSTQQGQMNMPPQRSPGPQPRLEYVENYPPTGPAYHQPSPQVSPLQSNIELTKMEQRNCDEQAAFAATIHKSYAEIRQATDNFNEKNLLGEGSFGRVYRAVIAGSEYAVKVLLQNENVQIGVQDNQRADQRKELAALAKYKHRNIVLMSFFSVDGEHPCIIYELLENGSLEDNLLCKGGKEPLPWKIRQQIAERSALAINHLHTAISNKPLIHGDIKSANILLNMHFEPKLGDFGLARPGPLNGKTCTFLKTQFAHGTLPYLPEEYKRNLQLSTKVDSFSFGVVLMEILTGERAYDKRRGAHHELLPDKVKEVMKQDMEGAVAQLKDKKAPDWPDDLFRDMLVLADRLTCESRKERPEIGTVVFELKTMNARYGLSRAPETERPIPTQNSDPLPDSTTDSSGSPKKPESEGSGLSAEEERQRAIDEIGRKCDSMTSSLMNRADRDPSQGGRMGPDGGFRHDAHMAGRMYQRQNGQMGPPGQNWPGEQMRPGRYLGPEGGHRQPPGGPMGPHGHMQGQAAMHGGGIPQYGPTTQGHDGPTGNPSMYSPGVSMVSPNAGPRRDQQESLKRFPSDYLLSQGQMGTNQPSGRYGVNPEPYMPRRDSEVEQAFNEGYQRGKLVGYQEGELAGYQRACREMQQMSMPSLHHSPRDGYAGRQYPSQATHGMMQAGSPAGYMPPSPGMPGYKQVSPLASFTSELRHLKEDPTLGHTLGNKTDDAKITNTEDPKDEISLKEMRQQKEPQQYTEPM